MEKAPVAARSLCALCAAIVLAISLPGGMAQAQGPRPGEILSQVLEHEELVAPSPGVGEETALRPCVARISAGDERFGSGVITRIGTDGIYVLTCAHVADQVSETDPELYVTLFTGGEYAVEVAEVSETRDVALLKVDIAALAPDELLRLRCVRGMVEVTAGERVYALTDESSLITNPFVYGLSDYDLTGTHTHVGKSVVTGEVISPGIGVEVLHRELMALDLEAVPGMSGGGVFTRDGSLAGIVVGRVDSGGEGGVTVAEPAGAIAEELPFLFR